MKERHGWSFIPVRHHIPQPQAQEKGATMKALVYHGPRDVRVTQVPDAKIQEPTDVLVKITTTNICRFRSPHVRGSHECRAGKGARP